MKNTENFLSCQCWKNGWEFYDTLSQQELTYPLNLARNLFTSMKIFNTKQMRAWEKFTMNKEQITSIDLMENAARECSKWLEREGFVFPLCVFAGTGNNGGDGLCIARHYLEKEIPVRVYVVGNAEEGTPDFKTNLDRLLENDVEVSFLSEENHEIKVQPAEVLIDAIFGTGISRPADGWRAKLIDVLNRLPNTRIAIDVPSGLMPDNVERQQGAIIRAEHTLTFEVPKPAFLFAENHLFVGKFELLPIGLSNDFHTTEKSSFHYYEIFEAAEDFRPRQKFTYKNERGHLQLLAGSKGKMGAAVLAANAAQRAGCGLVTTHIPQCGYHIMQQSVPEAMCETDDSENMLSSIKVNNERSALAIGPGIGTSEATAEMLRVILKEVKIPMVLDADALNIISQHQLLPLLPQHTIITPHIGEFDRLFGNHDNSFSRFETLRTKSGEHQIIIVLKGTYTTISTADQRVSFNASGTASLATAGSGDVLTGVIGSLLAQGYTPEIAARLGVFLHGHAARIINTEYGMEGIIARDMIDWLLDALNDVAEVKSFSGRD